MNDWWLERDSVKSVADKLGVSVVPDLGVMTVSEIVRLVKEGFGSRVAEKELVAEGVVVRSEPLVLFRDGEPVMWKLKVRDYERLKGGKR